jgi:IS4 transposase
MPLPKPVGRPRKVEEVTAAEEADVATPVAQVTEVEGADIKIVEEGDPDDRSSDRPKRKPKKSTKKNKSRKKSKKDIGKEEQRLIDKRARTPFTLLKDQRVRLSSQKGQQECPIDLRLVTIFDPIKKHTYRFLTNNFQLSPRTIADIYRDRWEVELFFKCIKQELLIKSFLGTSENAVRIQIYTAMIAVILVRYLLLLPKTVIWNFSNLIALLRINWFTYQDLFRWVKMPHCDKKPPGEEGEKEGMKIQQNKLF